STARALSGETYSTRVRCSRAACSSAGVDESRSSDHRNADRVLPDPVGATTSVWAPEEIESHAPSWAGVGDSNAPANHARVGAEKRSRMSVTIPSSTRRPTHSVVAREPDQSLYANRAICRQ